MKTIGASLLAVTTQAEGQSKTFGHDLGFLKQHKEVVLLKGETDASQVAVIADYQGRVMTSTSDGEQGVSYGWINHDLIASGEFRDHISVFGGEDRFWMGPEGGQYSIFFKKGDAFDLDHWYTPAPIDTEPFEVVEQSRSRASFRKKMKLQNYSGFVFDLQVDREVAVLTKQEAQAALGLALGEGVKFVGFQSVNEITNTGSVAWSKETGLLSIWILGMFNPSDDTGIIVPFVNTLKMESYFGDIPDDRLATTDNAVFFKGDGKYRSKIGLPPENIVPACGSYDAKRQLLTIVQYDFHGDTDYVNSQWELQDKPFKGDVVNSYNDGPVDGGDQLGPFYELESSSSAKALQPGQSVKHTHKTYHFEGNFEELNRISQAVLGVDLSQQEPLKQIGISQE